MGGVWWLCGFWWRVGAFYNPETNQCEQFLNENDRGQIVDNNVTDILIDQNQTLWVTMWNSGLFYKSLDNNGDFQSIQHDAGDFDSLSSNNTYSLLLDRSKVLWIGTLSAGINKINLISLQFRTYRNNGNNPSSIHSNHIGTFSETSDGTVWVGTWDSGLARFEPSTGSFTHSNLTRTMKPVSVVTWSCHYSPITKINCGLAH